jgi:hypothetical protein
VFRACPREYVGFQCNVPQLLLVQVFDIGSAQGRFTRADAEPFTDRLRGIDMVAGDHFDADAGAGAGCHRR